jgi:hypothetical protein
MNTHEVTNQVPPLIDFDVSQINVQPPSTTRLTPLTA